VAAALQRFTDGAISMQIKNKLIDFNDILKGANLLVAGSLVFTFWRVHGNEFVDKETVELAVLLCIQTQIALFFERRRRDPFVILLSFDMIFFFSLRIVTLTLYPFSVVFARYHFDADNSNFALIFILIANCFIYTGLHVAGPRRIQKIDSEMWRASSPARAVFLMTAALIFAYFSGGFWNQENIPRVFSFLVIFLTPTIAMLMALSYYLLFGKTLSRKFAISIAALIVADAVIHSLFGSRSAIIAVIQNVIFVALAIFGCIKLKRKYVLAGLVLLPAVLALLIATFVIATYNRSAKDAGKPLSLGQAIELIGGINSEPSFGTDFDLLIPPIADRAGYFDFSAEVIAHREEYASVFNLSTYAKSIIDNVLTPGFDVFDQPKISNALRFIYEGNGAPSKEWIVEENYHSDQVGIYGEFYGLFGYACLPLLFLIAFGFKHMYLRLVGHTPFVLAMKRVFILFIFVKTIDSFGVDWTILEALPLLVAMFIYTPFFSCRPVPLSSIGRAPGGTSNVVPRQLVSD
jgi:hypothetical protein